jgi:hypothetical protein
MRSFLPLWNQKYFIVIITPPPFDSILKYFNSLHVFAIYTCKISSNINHRLLFFLKVDLVPKRGCLTLAYYAFPRRYEYGERRWSDIFTGENRRTRRKTCPNATLSTTNHTWIGTGVNPDLQGERPATNDLSHGTALIRRLKPSWFFTTATLTVTGLAHKAPLHRDHFWSIVSPRLRSDHFLIHPPYLRQLQVQTSSNKSR